MRIRDSAGNIISDHTFAWGRITAVADIPASSSGSYSVPDLGPEYGTPWRRVYPVNAGFTWSSSATGPIFGGSGTTVTYTNPYAYAFKVIHGLR